MPVAVPLLTAKLLRPKLWLPCVAMRATEPVGWGEIGDTDAATLIGVPCVTFTALPPFSVSVVVEVTRLTEFQLFTKLVALTEPKPVAKS